MNFVLKMFGTAALASAAALASGCAATASSEANVITVALFASPNNLDPRLGSDEISQKIHQLLYNDLVQLDDQLRIVPELAERLETPDDRTYIAHLKRGVKFHDGRELTAADVAYTFGSFLDPQFVSPRKGAYRLLASVAARDRYTVVFTLKEPFGSFPINLVMGIIPADAGRGSARAPIGTGPYRFVSYTPDDRVVLEAFPEHFAGRPRNDGLVLKVVPDDTMRGLELRKGTIDLVVNDLAPDIVHQFQKEGRIRVAQAPGTDYMYIGFNLRDPVLRDRRVRHAISYAVDREAIVRHLRRGLATTAIGVVPPMSWAFERNVATFAHDPARARQLLDEAGYRDPDGDGPLPRLRLTLKTSTVEFVRLQAAVLQQDLRRVGINLEIRSYEFATLYADVLRGNFQMCTLQWVGVTDPDMLRRVFHSQQIPPNGFNRGFFEDPEVDRVIDQATRSVDEDERRQLYGIAQQRIAEAAPYVSLWYKTNIAVFQPSLAGVRLSPTAEWTFLKDVTRSLRQGSGRAPVAVTAR